MPLMIVSNNIILFLLIVIKFLMLKHCLAEDNETNYPECSAMEGMEVTCMDPYDCIYGNGTIYGRCARRYGLCCGRLISDLKSSSEDMSNTNAMIIKESHSISIDDSKNNNLKKNYISISKIVDKLKPKNEEKRDVVAANLTSQSDSDTPIPETEIEGSVTPQSQLDIILTENFPDTANVIDANKTPVTSENHEHIFLNADFLTIKTTKPEEVLKPVETLIDSLNKGKHEEICGRPVLPKSRITGGREAQYGQWPWQVFMLITPEDESLGRHMCGASLLNNEWIVTAAHCIENAPLDGMTVILGATHLTKDDTTLYPHVRRTVVEAHSHPEFHSWLFNNDIALLKFNESVDYAPNIIPICLPSKDMDGYNGYTGSVTGWGRLREGGDSSPHLLEAEVPIMNNSDCEAMFRRGGRLEIIPYIFICAGYEDGRMDTCEGDSGGPLAVLEEEQRRWVLVGISSWGSFCGHQSQPGVYTRVSQYKEYIEQYIDL